MRRTSHMGQKPRRLQLNAASLSWPQSLQRMRRQRRKKQWARVPHSRKVSNSALGVLLQVGTGSVCGLGEEGRGVLLNRVVQRGLFQAVVLVVKGGAARRSLGLPANVVNAKLPKWRIHTVSKPALRLNRLDCHRPVCVLCARGKVEEGAKALALAMPVRSWRTREMSIPALVLAGREPRRPGAGDRAARRGLDAAGSRQQAAGSCDLVGRMAAPLPGAGSDPGDLQAA